MDPLFGMAGLAEAAESATFLTGCGGLLLLGLSATIAVFTRSRVAAGIALSMAVLIAALFVPWDAFRPYRAGDSDGNFWIARWRAFGWGWGIAAAAALVGTVRAFPARAGRRSTNG